MGQCEDDIKIPFPVVHSILIRRECISCIFWLVERQIRDKKLQLKCGWSVKTTSGITPSKSVLQGFSRLKTGVHRIPRKSKPIFYIGQKRKWTRDWEQTAWAEERVWQVWWGIVRYGEVRCSCWHQNYLRSWAIIDNGPAARTFAAFIQTHHGTIQRDFINLVSAAEKNGKEAPVWGVAQFFGEMSYPGS